MELKGLLKVDRHKVESGHYAMTAQVPTGADATAVAERQYHFVKRPSGKSWEAIEVVSDTEQVIVATAIRLGDVQSEVYDELDRIVARAQKLFDAEQAKRVTITPTRNEFDRSAADAILLDLLPEESKRVTLDEWSAMITRFLEAWYMSPYKDMYQFGKDCLSRAPWVPEELDRRLADGTADYAPSFTSGEPW